MVNPLNLYATKVFEEHPLGLWALDDRADYVSLLDESDQNLNNWSIVGADQVVDAKDGMLFTRVPPSIPFPDVFANGVLGESNNNGLVQFVSSFSLEPENFDLSKESLSFGLYLYAFDKIINLRLGFRYTDPESQEIFEVIKSASISGVLSWGMFSETFNLPESFTDLRLIIEAYYDNESLPYEFAINAITAGQWAEEFQLKSFGANLIDVPSSINIPETKGVPAKQYGLPSNVGYYIAKDNSLVARNLGVPLVYGSKNSTYIVPKENSPSLIIPAFGFLNEAGQFNDLTAEFWIKIQSKAFEPRKIFGPIGSSDGLYVEGPFLKLKIGPYVGSHNVREWDRPMLVNIRISSEEASLIINGESVFSLTLDPTLYRFAPSRLDELDQNWLGFYAYEDVPIIQIDCVAIYPYAVSSILAKRKWVYGQAVQVPETIKGADSTSSVFVDYPFAKYAKNYYFPSNSKWSSGNNENLIFEDDSLLPPRHPLPIANFSERDEETWLNDLKENEDLSDPFITLRPNEEWENIEGNLFFENLNLLSDQTRSFYGVFKSEKLTPDPQTLFEITNSTSSDFLKIYVQGDVLSSSNTLVEKVILEVEDVEDIDETEEDEEVIDQGVQSEDELLVRVSNFPHAFRNGSVLNVYDSEIIPSGIYEVINVFSSESFELQPILFDSPGIDFDENFEILPDDEDEETEEPEEEEEEAEEVVRILGPQEDFSLKIIHESTIYYKFYRLLPAGNYEESLFYTTPGQKINQKYFVGIDIPRFVKSRGEELANFIGTRQNLSVYVAGNQSLDETFIGNIYRIGFCTEKNLNKIKHLFNENGFPVDYQNVFDSFGPASFDAGANYFNSDVDITGNAISPPPSFWSLILDGGSPYDFATISAEEHVASYTLIPKNNFDNFVLDIATDSYWEDYVPLSYFAKPVEDIRVNVTNSLSFIQFNIDYPFFNLINNNKIDTSFSNLKTYVSFQYLKSGSNATDNFFLKIEKLNADRVVSPDKDWMNTKYEVVNGSVIYPPQNVDINSLSLNVYIEMVSDGIYSNPLKIRSLQLSSQTYGHSPNRVGTKFGTDLVPFVRSGKYFNYKLAPAIAIYKGSTPYFYNTSDSGIELKIPYSNDTSKGIAMPINPTASEFFKIGSFQMYFKYGEDLFPKVPRKIFEIEHSDGIIGFFVVADSKNRKRGQLYALNETTKRIQSGLMFFNNGIPVKRPVLYPNTWTVVGMSFPQFLDFKEKPGALRITSPIMFNNISYYQTTLADDEERFGFRQWFAVRSQLGNLLDWGYWAGKELVSGQKINIPGEGFTWQEVLFLSSIVREELDAARIYNIFTGTERIVSDVDKSFLLSGYQYTLYNNTQWSANTTTAV